MKLRKHLGRRVFALFLALLLSFNSLTVLAEDNPVNPETPAAESVEVTEPADDTEVPTGTEAVDAESVEATEAEDTAESTEAKAEVKDGGVDESLNSEAAVNAEQPETEQPETEPAEEELPETKTETTDGETDSSETDVTPSEAEVQDREPAVNAQEDAPAVEEQKTADIADTDANVQKEADLPAEPVQDEISAGDGEVEAAPTEYATVDEFMEAIAAMGDAEDLESTYAALDNCDFVYNRLTPEDQEAVAEYYEAIQAYRNDPDAGVDTLALNTGHSVNAKFRAIYVNGDNKRVGNGDTISRNFTCAYSVNHSDTAYSNHTISYSEMRQIANGMSVSAGYTLKGWGRSDPYINGNKVTYYPFKYSGSESLNKGEYMYFIFQADVHTHSYFSVVTQSPTCTTAGVKTYTCNASGTCDRKTYTESIPALGHTYIGATWVDNNGSSSHYDGCTTTQHKQVCTRCGLAPQYADHTYGNWYTSGTLEKRDCTVCNHYETRSVTIPDVSLSYSGNGNTGGSAPASITVKKGSSVVVKNSGTLSKDNAEFLGWSTDPNAEEPELKYAPGSDVVLNASIILYAVWKDKVVLGVEKTVDKAEAKVGDILTYTIVVKNSGNKSVNNVVISDNLPEGLKIETVTLNGVEVKNYSGSVVVEMIASKGEAKLVIKAQVEKAGELKNKATVKSDELTTPVPSNEVTTTVNPDTPKDETTTLSVTKSADKTELKPGDEVEYTITVRNTGANAAKNVTVTDKLDSSLTFVSAKLTVNGSETNVTPDAEGRYTIGEIAQGGEAVLKITAKVSEDLDTEAVTSIRNVATAGYENKPSEPTDPEDPDSQKEPIEDPKGEVETPVSPEDPENPDNPDTPEKPDATYTVTWVSGYDDTVYQTENNLKREDIADNHPTTEPTREGYTFTGWNIGEPDADGNIVVTAQWTPTEPTDPEGPTDPETPTEPTDPEGPTEPTDPEGPTDPETPTEPTDPEGPTDPETPTEPTDPEGATDPETPTEPTDPETPTEPTDPEGPTDSETPGEPTDPEGPTDPETPAEPTEPENPTPGTPAGPTPGTPDEPETEAPDEPADAEQPVTPPAPVPVPVTVTPAAATPVAAQIVPVNPTPVTPAAENEPAAPEEEVTLPEETVPAAAPEEETETVDIGDEEVPMAEFGGKGSPAWALLNLILTILTALISLLLLTFYFTGKRKEENEERAGRNTEDEDEDELKRKGLIRLLSILPAVFAVITFILTEDMRNPMIIVDRWTILMLLYAVVNVVLAVFAIKKREEKEEEKAVK